MESGGTFRSHRWGGSYLFPGEFNMPLFYSINKRKHLVISVGMGTVTVGETFLHLKLLANDKNFNPSFSHILDMTGILNFEINAEDIQRLSRMGVFSSGSRLALVAMGLRNMHLLNLCCEIFLRTGRAVKVFSDQTGALKWLSTSRRPSPGRKRKPKTMAGE
jgi:hypothetical protein